MLPSQNRISRRDFKEILENKGVFVVYNRLGTLKYLSKTPYKLSVVTSSKHEKSAVARNKVRRRIYTLFREAQKPIQGVFYVAKSSYRLPLSDVKRLLYELLTKTQTTAQ